MKPFSWAWPAFVSRVVAAAAALACLLTVARAWSAPAGARRLTGSSAAAGPAVPQGRPRYGGTLRVEMPVAIRTLDPSAGSPNAAETSAREAFFPLVVETLTRVDVAGVEPLLADSWQSDAQGKRWEFHLRPGLVLHDRTPLTASQVAVALRAASANWVVTDADDRIVIEPQTPAPDLPWQLADPRFAIVVPRAAGLPLGTGPFRLDRWEPGARLVLAANEDYRRGRPFLDGVQIDMGRALRDEVMDLEVGRADLVTVPPQDVHRVTQRGLRVATSRPLELIGLVFDTRRPAAFQEPLRNAVALAIDRAAICTILLQRQANVATALLPDWLSGYASIFPVRYDRTAARSIVASLPADRRTLVVEYPADDPVASAVADRLAVDLRETGLGPRMLAAGGTSVQPPDARLMRVALGATTPERALGRLVAALGINADGVPPPGSPLEDTARFEQALIERSLVVPLVHVSRIYGLGGRLEVSAARLTTASGGLDLANVWLREDRQ